MDSTVTHNARGKSSNSRTRPYPEFSEKDVRPEFVTVLPPNCDGVRPAFCEQSDLRYWLTFATKSSTPIFKHVCTIAHLGQIFQFVFGYLQNCRKYHQNVAAHGENDAHRMPRTSPKKRPTGTVKSANPVPNRLLTLLVPSTSVPSLIYICLIYSLHGKRSDSPIFYLLILGKHSTGVCA